MLHVARDERSVKSGVRERRTRQYERVARNEELLTVRVVLENLDARIRRRRWPVGNPCHASEIDIPVAIAEYGPRRPTRALVIRPKRDRGRIYDRFAHDGRRVDVDGRRDHAARIVVILSIDWLVPSSSTRDDPEAIGGNESAREARIDRAR